MNIFYAMLLSVIFLSAAALAKEGEGGNATVWKETVQADDGGDKFTVQLDQTQKTVEVVRENQNAGKPPHLRLRILRKNDRPFEVKLHLVDRPNDIPRYSGDASLWQGSVVGFQLEFSFDKKTWKRVGKTVSKVLP